MLLLWKKKNCLIPLVVLMLSFSVLCLETVTKDTSVQPGRLIIGSSRATSDGIDEKVHDEHAGDTKGYQSDQPHFTEGSGLGKLLLRRWSPSVSCDKDSMTLHMQGSQVPNFLVETDKEGPVPLSKIPSQCGYSVKRARRDVALVAKYDGCNVEQQGSTYILPLSILGVAVKMVCPVPRPVATVSCNPSAMVASLGLSPDAVRLKVNGEWQSIYQASTCGFTWDVVEGALRLTVPYSSNCWQFQGSEMHLLVQYMDEELPLSCPAIQYTAAGPAYMAQAIDPWLPGTYHGYGYPWYLQYGQRASDPVATKPPTTTAAPARDRQALNPWLARTWYLPYGLRVSDPAAIKAPTTTAAPARDRQALNPWLAGTYNPYGYAKPWYLPYGLRVSDPVTTKAPTTTAAPARDRQALNPWLAGTYNPHGYAKPWYLPYGLRVSDPVTTTAEPARDRQALNPWLAGTYTPYAYAKPWYLPYGLRVSPQTTTTTGVPSSDQLPVYPGLAKIYNPYVPIAVGGVQQVYQIPGVNAFQRNPTLPQKLHPSKPDANPGPLTPLLIKGPGK